MGAKMPFALHSTRELIPFSHFAINKSFLNLGWYRMLFLVAFLWDFFCNFVK
jgi:hypothetical protein